MYNNKLSQLVRDVWICVMRNNCWCNFRCSIFQRHSVHYSLYDKRTARYFQNIVDTLKLSKKIICMFVLSWVYRYEINDTDMDTEKRNKKYWFVRIGASRNNFDVWRVVNDTSDSKRNKNIRIVLSNFSIIIFVYTIAISGDEFSNHFQFR